MKKILFFNKIIRIMMGFIKFIQKRPTDKTILIGRVIFGLLYIGIMYYNLIILNKGIDSEYIFNTILLNETNINIAKYAMISVGIIPIIMGATNICIHKRKYVRIMQIIFGIILFYIVGSLKESPNLDYDMIIGLMGILPLIAGITGKCITTKCMKYKETITKIRV